MGWDIGVRISRDVERFGICLFDSAYCLGDVTEYDGGGGTTGAYGSLLGVSKHKMLLPNLIGEGGVRLSDGSLPVYWHDSGGQGQSPVSTEPKATLKLWGCVWSIRSLLVPVLSPGSPRTDTLIIVLSWTKIGNRSDNNRCVSFHIGDLLPDMALSVKPCRIQVSKDDDPEKRLREQL